MFAFRLVVSSISVYGNLKSYCVPERCPLCRYRFEKNDGIIVPGANSGIGVVQDGLLAPPVVYSYERGTAWNETDPTTNTLYSYSFCDERCCNHLPFGEENEIMPGFHSRCYLDGPTNPEFLAAFRYAFNPMPDVDRARQRNIRDDFVNTVLRRSSLGKLPSEILVKICDYIDDEVRQYAVERMETLWSHRQSSNSMINPLKAAWGRYVCIDGVDYLEAISNLRMPGFVQIWEANSTSDVSTVYVLEDHLGIQQLVLAKDTKLPSDDDDRHSASSWWRMFPLSEGSRKLMAMSDGLKLRRITSELSWFGSNMLLPEPLTASQLEALSYSPSRNLRQDAKKGCRLVPFSINGPNVTGYSFCWSQGFIHMQVHQRGERCNFYRDFDASTDRIRGIVGPEMDFVPIPDSASPVEILMRSNLFPEAGQQLSGKGVFVSTAPLAGIKEIFPCRQKWLGSVITGLLLVYYDRSRVALGDFRFDRVIEPSLKIPPQGIDNFYLGSDKSSWDPFLYEIFTTRPTDQGNRVWTRLPFKNKNRLCCTVEVGNMRVRLETG